MKYVRCRRRGRARVSVRRLEIGSRKFKFCSDVTTCANGSLLQHREDSTYIFAAATDASKRFMVQDIVIMHIKPLEKTRVVAAAPCRAATEPTGLRAGRVLEK